MNPDADYDELKRVLNVYALMIIQETWSFWNATLEIEAAFDVTDPRIAKIAAKITGMQLADITKSTRKKLQQLLEHAAREGWSIQQIISGDEDWPGIRDLVTETYKGRYEAIARTELGMAQNLGSAERFVDMGATHAHVFDNNMPNSHEFCVQVDGHVVTIEWMMNNPLQHPRCVRAFGPVFDWTGPVWEDELAFGAHW